MNETSKACERRVGNKSFADRYFVGHGIDIGAGSDSLGLWKDAFPNLKSVYPYDIKDGDDQYLSSVNDDSFDFVYSSHCLEHMKNPYSALENWIRVLKVGGYLVFTVPDEDMYERLCWPSQFNSDHKHSFTLSKPYKALENSINVVDFIKKFDYILDFVSVSKIDSDYNESLNKSIDQTRGKAECAIEIVAKKRLLTLNDVLKLALNEETIDDLSQSIHILQSYLKYYNEFELYSYLSNILTRLKKFERVNKLWLSFIDLYPNHRLAHLYYSLFLISIESYDAGFSLRDTLVSDERRTKTSFPSAEKKWTGQPLHGKSIVLWTEFGLGDEIMFSRFAKIFKSNLNANKVIIVCQDPLFELFKNIEHVNEVVSGSNISSLKEFDYWIFPHSIPKYYSLDSNGVPDPVIFKLSDSFSKETNSIINCIPKKSGKFNVGICFNGDPTHENDMLRSIHNIKPFFSIFDSKHINWINFSKSIDNPHIFNNSKEGATFFHIGKHLDNFQTTAVALEQIDLLVTVDTSIVHLAGSMNIPTILLLPAVEDWRWCVNKDFSSWYPKVSIIRQSRMGNWSDVVNQLNILIHKKLLDSMLTPSQQMSTGKN